MQIGKEEVKLSLFAEDMIVYVEKSEEIYNKDTRVSEVSKVSRYKNQLYFYILATSNHTLKLNMKFLFRDKSDRMC